MLALSISAPFATCRSFTAGWYRPSATFISPSMAYGLLLNFAGIEMRLLEHEEGHAGKVPASLHRSGLPKMRLALGVPSSLGKQVQRDDPEAFPHVQTLYQQLHNYPVGSSGQSRADDCKGGKYNITPVRREFLSRLRAVIVVDAEEMLLEQFRFGIENGGERYGLPFLGDNNFLLEKASSLEKLPPCYWYERVDDDSSELRPRTTRLTVWIDRVNSAGTASSLYSPTSTALNEVPPAAWTSIVPG